MGCDHWCLSTASYKKEDLITSFIGKGMTASESIAALLKLGIRVDSQTYVLAVSSQNEACQQLQVLEQARQKTEQEKQQTIRKQQESDREKRNFDREKQKFDGEAQDKNNLVAMRQIADNVLQLFGVFIIFPHFVMFNYI